jgi:hypothetical protein
VSRVALHEAFGPAESDKIAGKHVIQHWFRDSPDPMAGILKVEGKWYVWPVKWFRRYDGDFNEEFEEFLANATPYETRHAAATACRLLYSV